MRFYSMYVKIQDPVRQQYHRDLYQKNSATLLRLFVKISQSWRDAECWWDSSSIIKRNANTIQ